MKTKDRVPVIQLTHITKKYTIHHEKPTLVEKFVSGKNESFIALNDINLTIWKGDRVGLIGPNGSGKTTLLKIIAKIATPTHGHVYSRGNLVSLIDLEAGFHPDLTGIQNIYLNGMLLGMSQRIIKKNLDNIIKFADIKQFIDAPMYTYSTGMKFRLGFAIAAHSKPDIILLDEGLSAGDSVFQKKVQQKLDDMFKDRVTIIVSSHLKRFINYFCKRLVVLKNGSIAADGNKKIGRVYLE